MECLAGQVRQGLAVGIGAIDAAAHCRQVALSLGAVTGCPHQFALSDREPVFLARRIQDLERVAHEVKEKPSINDVTVEIGKQYKTPIELRLLLLAQTRNAFDCLKQLSQEERSAINQALAVAGDGARSKGSDRLPSGET